MRVLRLLFEHVGDGDDDDNGAVLGFYHFL
jgi:hypothetical protein